MVKKKDRSRKAFICDFETTTDPDDCRVWAYGYMQIGNKRNYAIGNSLDEFMAWVEAIKGDLYFHNLKFDGEFIVNWLLKNGYEFDPDGKPRTFNTIISRMGQWYMIDICYGYWGKKKLHTVIYDSLKKLPFPVEVIAKAFNLEIRKGDIDYHAYRPVGHTITDEEKAYIKNDIEIVADALHIQFTEGLTKMTNGSDSLEGFKTVINKKKFDKLFPQLSLETDKEIRKAYRGGFTWLNNRYKEKEIGEGLVYDVNSLYPSQMYHRPLPYGMPVMFDGKYEYDPDYPLYIQALECEFEIKENHIPTIQIKNQPLFFKGNEYLKSSNGERVQLYVTNVDLELIQNHYHLYDVTYLNGFKFKQKTGIFNEFIDQWMHVKMTETGAKKQLAKLMLNSLYGKFATNPDVTGKVPYLNDDGSCGFTTGEEETKDPVYTPMGVFITSWARYTTITTAQKCYDRIIYCDTDSIHLEGSETPDAIRDQIDPDALGLWDHESTFIRAKFLRQKTYLEDVCMKWVDGKKKQASIGDYETTELDVKCAGMPNNIKDKATFDNFEVGFSSYGKLLPQHVNNGIVLRDTEFTIK